MTYLLDTNVISEIRKPRPAAAVVAWVAGLRTADIHLSVLTIGELRTGAARLALRGDPTAARSLADWISGLEERFPDQILPVTPPIVARWAELNAPRPRPAIDSLIAATALVHGLVVATRNTKDFSGTGARVLDPFTTAP